MKFLESHGRLLDEFPESNEQGVASLLLYSLRRNGPKARSGMRDDMQGTGTMAGSQ